MSRTNHARKPNCQARRCATPRGTPRICASDGDHIRVPLRAMLDLGIPIGAGSDAPSAPPDPGPGIAAATDRNGDPAGYSFDPAQTMTRSEAVYAYTIGAARCLGQSQHVGSLAPGMQGNLVAWNTDLLSATSVEVAAARPVLTVIDGDVAWAAPQA